MSQRWYLYTADWGMAMFRVTADQCCPADCVCVCAMCREQWHAVNCPHGHWSCSCVACWKDKATARASDGWHSTLAELTAVRGCCFVTCCAAQQIKNKFYCFIFSVCIWNLSTTYSISSLYILTDMGLVFGTLLICQFVQRLLNIIVPGRYFCQFIGIIGLRCICLCLCRRALLCVLCSVLTEYRWAACEMVVTIK